MAETGAAGTLGELLARRGRRFVGRSRERELFVRALTESPAPFPVLHVHGPGGVGKTALLDVYAELAATHDAHVVRIDGRALPPTPPDLLDALGSGLVVSTDGTVAARRPASRLVLLLDGYELLEPVDEWVREWLLPKLPASAVTVLSGRAAPGPAWLTDPAWRELLLVIPLRGLGRKEAYEYLDECGVHDGPVRDRIISLAHGHPLGLSLLTEVALRRGAAAVDPPGPDLVGTLLRRLIETVPDGPHRRALDVCALARVTTESLLRDALEVDDAHELFSWLRSLSFVEDAPEGLCPHDLAREALEADLRWRDPESYRSVVRGIRRHVIGRLGSTSGREQQRVLLDAKYLHRLQPESRVWADWESFGRHHVEPAQPADLAAIRDIVGQWEGDESAALAQHWWTLQPDAFAVVRHHDGQVRGCLATVDLSRAAQAEIAVDPCAVAAWRHASARSGRAGDPIVQGRFSLDREAGQRPSPTMNLAPVVSIQRWLATPGLTMAFLTLADPEYWDDYFAFFEIRRVPDADVDLGGRRYGLFVRDFRQLPLDRWLDLMFERDLAGHDAAAPDPPPGPELSRADFDRAVRQALRDLRRTGLLARNPLVRSRLVLGHDPGDAPAALAAVVRETAGRLRDDPRDEKLFRVLDRTYLRPAATQERAAEVLDLPLSTYKRHLRRSVERLVADLWEHEQRSADDAPGGRDEPTLTPEWPGG